MWYIQAYFARIGEVNLKGPALRAVIELNPSALAQAASLDKERKSKGKRPVLHGIPILLKASTSDPSSTGKLISSYFCQDNMATVASEGQLESRCGFDVQYSNFLQE